MIKELQSRPFVRPLFFWITGTLLCTIFPYRLCSVILFALPVGSVLFLCVFSSQNKKNEYSSRWLWGFVFSTLLICLSAERTSYSLRSEIRLFSNTRIEKFAITEQQHLLDTFSRLNLNDDEKSVLATITLGYRKSLNRDVRSRFSISGVAHILAVSGFHVACVCGFLIFIFSLFPNRAAIRWIKYILTLLLLWSFTVISGLAASAVRSALMFSLYITGRMIGREAERYNVLAASAFLMLVYNPLYFFDIGFQLSYLAVLSIIYFQPKLRKLIKVRNPLFAAPWSWITVSLSAQIGVTFLCLYYFGQFSTVFLLTNLPLTLIASLLIPAALVWMLLPASLPGMGYLQWFVEFLTRSLLQVVNTFSNIPFATISFHFGFVSMLLNYLMLFWVICYFRTKRHVYLLVILSVLLVLLVLKMIERYSFLVL